MWFVKPDEVFMPSVVERHKGIFGGDCLTSSICLYSVIKSSPLQSVSFFCFCEWLIIIYPCLLTPRVRWSIYSTLTAELYISADFTVGCFVRNCLNFLTFYFAIVYTYEQ